VQTPISPPYAAALSLLENTDTDFRKADVSVVIENEGPSSISEFKKHALSITDCKSYTESDTATKAALDENKDSKIADALQNLYLSEESEHVDNN
jgi:hypothetical protein